MPSKTFMVITSFVLVLILISGCNLFGSEQSDPERTVLAYLEAFKYQDYKKMTELQLHGREIDPEKLWELFGLAEAPSNDSETDFSVSGTQMTHDTKADVYVKVTTIIQGEEITRNVVFRLEKKDGIWFIDI